MLGEAAPPRPHSPEPWALDRNDDRIILDAEQRLVAVTTMPEDTVRILAAVNAVQGMSPDGLAARPLLECLQALFELTRYHRDPKFREATDKNAGFEKLLARCDAAWGAFGEDSFRH